MKTFPEQDSSEFDRAAEEAVKLGNRIVDENDDADPWDIASGVLAGAVHFWLYTRQPCGDPHCESCEKVSTAEQRLKLLIEEVRQSAEESDYYHSPHDANVGRA
jgi:hypothetical protein